MATLVWRCCENCHLMATVDEVDEVRAMSTVFGAGTAGKFCREIPSAIKTPSMRISISTRLDSTGPLVTIQYRRMAVGW